MINNLCELSVLSGKTGENMNFELTEEQRMIQQTAREFAVEELLPGLIERDERGY